MPFYNLNERIGVGGNPFPGVMSKAVICFLVLLASLAHPDVARAGAQLQDVPADLYPALTLFREGWEASQEGSRTGLERALNRWDRSGVAFSASGDSRRQGMAVYNTGWAHERLGNLQEALYAYRQSRWTILLSDDSVGALRSLLAAAGVAAALGDGEAFEDSQQEAREYARRLRISPDSLATLRSSRPAMMTRADSAEALYQRALRHLGVPRPLPRDPTAADYEDALRYLEPAISRFDEIDEQSLALGWMGYGYYRLGRYHHALVRFERALAAHRAARNRPEVANNLRNIGVAYASLTEPDSSMKYLCDALGEFTALGREPQAQEVRDNIRSVSSYLRTPATCPP